MAGQIIVQRGAGSTGGGGGTPGGSNTQVQFNDGGAFGGDDGLVFNKTTNALTLGTAGTPGSLLLPGAQPVTLMNSSGNPLFIMANSQRFILYDGTNICLSFEASAGSPNIKFGAGEDLVLIRDGSGILAQRNGTNAQTFNLYETFTDSSNYGRMRIGIGGANFVITTEAAGTGTARDIVINTNGPGSSLTITTGSNTPGNFSCGRFRGSNGSTESIQMSAHESTIDMGSGVSLQWSDASAYNGTRDLRFQRRAAGILALTNPNAAGAALEFLEMTAPSAGAANTGRIFLEDNGSGKTRAMIQFATGAAVQFAIEP